jgi:hemerythrin-like domain-containing protein
MLRNPNLVPLSRQHHDGLALCVLTDRSLAADSEQANVQKLADEVIDKFDHELLAHFRLEEEVLFTALPEETALITRLLQEHRELEAMVGEMRTRPSADCLRRFTTVLRAHIRVEENELFERVQTVLPPAELARIGQIIEMRTKR